MEKPCIHIQSRAIGPGHPVYIIAEIGINHNGDPGLAREMILAAQKCGADAVKFQVVTADRCYTRTSASWEIFRKVEFSREQWGDLFDLCHQAGIAWFATFASVADLEDHAASGCPAFKVSSSNITNTPLIEAMARFGKPVLLSSGMSYLQELHGAVAQLRALGQREIALLQCTSMYPAPFAALNLRVLRTLAEEFPDCPVGFSDHSEGSLAAVVAVAQGAVLIEKHMTMDKAMIGPDHHFSADPEEFASLVRDVRRAQDALGSGQQVPAPEEAAGREKFRRSVVALRDIAAGEVFTAENIGLKRSGAPGLAPDHFKALLGRRTTVGLSRDAVLTADIVDGEINP